MPAPNLAVARHAARSLGVGGSLVRLVVIFTSRGPRLSTSKMPAIF